MAKTTLTLITMILGILILLGYMTAIGSTMAAIALAVLFTIAVFCAGSALTIYTVQVMQSKQQQDFLLNQQENERMMQEQYKSALQLQKLQNAQNSQLLNQARQLPDNGNHFLMAGDIFSELED